MTKKKLFHYWLKRNPDEEGMACLSDMQFLDSRHPQENREISAAFNIFWYLILPNNRTSW